MNQTASVAIHNLKETIIHESLKLFSLKGFLSTSMQDILKAAATSKGGFYNHFQSKEELFFHVLDQARRIWRERNLTGLDSISDPIEKIKQLLVNYRDLYLKDSDNFPGGCIFITLLTELNDQRPHLAGEILQGFNGLKKLLKRNLERGKTLRRLPPETDTDAITEMLFSGMIGASVIYKAEKSSPGLDAAMNALIAHIVQLQR